MCFFVGQTKHHLWALTVKHHLLFFCMIWEAGFQLHQHVQFNCVYLFLMEININNLRIIFLLAVFDNDGFGGI